MKCIKMSGLERFKILLIIQIIYFKTIFSLDYKEKEIEGDTSYSQSSENHSNLTSIDKSTESMEMISYSSYSSDILSSSPKFSSTTTESGSTESGSTELDSTQLSSGKSTTSDQMTNSSPISTDITSSPQSFSNSITDSTQVSSERSTSNAIISFTTEISSSFSSLSSASDITSMLSTFPDLFELTCDFVSSCLPENSTLLFSQPFVVSDNIMISSSNSINQNPINSSEKCQNPFFYQGIEYSQCISIDGVLKCRVYSGQLKECSKNQTFFLSNGTLPYKKSLSIDIPNFKPGFFDISFKTLMFCEENLVDCKSGNDFIRLIGDLGSNFRQSETLFDFQYTINDIQNDILWKEKSNRFYVKNSGNLKLTIEFGREKASQNDVFIGFDSLKFLEKKINPNQVQDTNILLPILLAFCISAAIISIAIVFLLRKRFIKKNYFESKNLDSRQTVQF